MALRDPVGVQDAFTKANNRPYDWRKSRVISTNWGIPEKAFWIVAVTCICPKFGKVEFEDELSCFVFKFC